GGWAPRVWEVLDWRRREEGGRVQAQGRASVWPHHRRDESACQPFCADEKGARNAGPFVVMVAGPRSEVERQAGCHRREGRTADRIVLRVAAAQCIAVAARPEAVVRAGPLPEVRADQIPAGPLVEPEARAEADHA